MTNPKNKICAVSLFSGCGGLDIGAHNAGVELVFATDIDKDSVSTMKDNKIFGKTHIWLGDVTELKCREVISMAGLNKKRPKYKLIVIGGPPCQPFSKAGYWVGNHARL